MKVFQRLVPVALIGCLLVAANGCKSSQPISRVSGPTSPGAKEAGSSRTNQDRVFRRGRSMQGDQPGDFDFYVLNLSWSPEFCTTHPDNAQCAARPGFIVHGLWPQNNDGTYPENCVGMPAPPNAAAYLDLMPDVNLIDHEWRAHGTCSGMNPEEYFTAVRSAFREVEIPDTFARSQEPPASITPNALLAEFSRANPTFPPSSFALTCGNNYLTAAEVCFDKGLRPQPCQHVHTCGATRIKIAPR
jgi:ribonuclease T2